MMRPFVARTAIESLEDVHAVVVLSQAPAANVILKDFNFGPTDAGMFSMILAELTANIVEHAEAGGYIELGTQPDRLIITIEDFGVGFRGSLRATARC